MNDASQIAKHSPRLPADGIFPPAWLRILDEHGAVHGYHRRLGPRHGALLTEDDETLLVTFEDAIGIRGADAPHLPIGLSVAGREGWSHLCLYSEGETFFRDPAVYRYFDDLVDDGFFDRFDRVIFYGAGAAGYAAAAFSVAAPLSSVVAIRPLATLDPRRTEWDRRHPALRRTDFIDRYGYAPDMVDGADSVMIVYDPTVLEDAMHASLFDDLSVCKLRFRRLGETPERDLAEMGILLPMLRAAGKGQLDRAFFYRLCRRRRDHQPYLERVLDKLTDDNRVGLRHHWARGVLQRLEAQQNAEPNEPRQSA